MQDQDTESNHTGAACSSLLCMISVVLVKIVKPTVHYTVQIRP